MNILTLDTCFNKSYIVLGDETSVIQSEIIESNEKNYHSAYVITVLRDILVKNNLPVKDIDVIGINIGPGSFTGVRAGITITRVLAQQFNIKLIGIPSLEILSRINKENSLTTVVLDARKNKVYFGEYQNGIEITKPCLKDKETLDIKDNSIVITDSSIHDFLNRNSINYEQVNDNLGVYLYNIVKNKLLFRQKSNGQPPSQTLPLEGGGQGGGVPALIAGVTNEEGNWAKVKPLYIQKPSITKPKENKGVL